MSTIYKIYGNELADTKARERLDALDGGGERTSYEEKGDLYTLLTSAEVTNMALSGKRIYKSNDTYVAQNYSNNTIHFFDPSLINYDRVLVYVNAWSFWSEFCYYDPDADTYTSLGMTARSHNTASLLQLANIPEGCYLAISSPNDIWTTTKYYWLGRIWINPNYVPKFAGLDESVTKYPIPVELYPVNNQSYPTFYIDMSNFTDRLVRLVRNDEVSSNYGHWSTNTLGAAEQATTYFDLNDFSVWLYKKQYLVFYFRDINFMNQTYNMTMGWIDPEVARMQKQKHYWGSNLAAHNADTKTELIHACVWSDIVDIDVCRTLDGYYVLKHGTEINGHTIAETNLADLGLTMSQMEITEAFAIMKEYGTFCFQNIRETTQEQYVELVERTYNELGRACVYSEAALASGSPLQGHVAKYYAWSTPSTVDAVVNVGFLPERIYASKEAEATNYNYHDWITLYSLSGLTSADDLPTDGEYGLVSLYDNIENLLNG